MIEWHVPQARGPFSANHRHFDSMAQDSDSPCWTTETQRPRAQPFSQWTQRIWMQGPINRTRDRRSDLVSSVNASGGIGSGESKNSSRPVAERTPKACDAPSSSADGQYRRRSTHFPKYKLLHLKEHGLGLLGLKLSVSPTDPRIPVQCSIPMGVTWDQAIGALTAEGQQFELTKALVNGVEVDVFKNAPPHLGLVFAAARQHGDKTFLVYEGERWSFNDAVDRLDALASLLVNTYGVKKGDRVGWRCATTRNGWFRSVRFCRWARCRCR